MEWSEDLVLQLIEAYRDRPVLWDVRHECFKIKSKRNDVWEELATLFNTNRYEVKKKVNSLLASFRRERRKVICTSSGIGTDEVSQSKWFAFKSLLFLMDKSKLKQIKYTDEGTEHDDFEKSGATRDMENGTSSTNDLEIDYSDHAKGCTTDRPLSQEKRCKRKEFLSPKNTFSANKKRIVEDPRVMEAYKILKEVSERNEKRDDCIVYGEHIAHKLRGYDSCTRAIVQHHISNILFEADMGKYFNGNPYKQQLMQWDSDSGKNNQHGPSAPNISSVSPSLQSQRNMDEMKIKPSSQWEAQLPDMTKVELPASFNLVTVKCEVEEEAQNFMTVKSDMKDELISEEHEVKIEDEDCIRDTNATM